MNLSLARSFGKKVSVSVTGLNVANSHLLMGDGLTFGGTHFNNPRDVFAQVRYRFHY